MRKSRPGSRAGKPSGLRTLKMLSSRSFVARGLGIALSLAVGPALFLSACSGGADAESTITQQEPETRLRSRPHGGASNCSPGVHPLPLAPGRKALLHVAPLGRRPNRTLLLALHGAGSGGARGGLWIFRQAWRVPGLVIAAPAAAGTTRTLGASDIRFIDRTLQHAFARCPVNPHQVAVGGFSAGASLALWLGLTNGDLFSSVIALSPGGLLPQKRVGKPEVFIAHGSQDDVIPISRGGGLVARRLQDEGYRVTYRRFDGGHRVLPAIAIQAVRRIHGA
jgi:phospholipase/carboxylesterase